jgi:hypothetical protein
MASFGTATWLHFAPGSPRYSQHRLPLASFSAVAWLFIETA